MKKIFLCAMLLSGCATNSGVIPEGKESYLLIISGGYGLASSINLKIDAHKQANEFCMKLDKRPETISEKTTQTGMRSDFYEEELKFKCVAGPNISSAPVAPTSPAPIAPASSAPTAPTSPTPAAPTDAH